MNKHYTTVIRAKGASRISKNEGAHRKGDLIHYYFHYLTTFELLHLCNKNKYPLEGHPRGHFITFYLP